MTMDTATLMPRWAWEVWVLCVWWSTWTLADTYLIPYTPTSELLVLGVCLSTLALVLVRGKMRGWKRSLETELANVTQSHHGNQYGKQVDAV